MHVTVFVCLTYLENLEILNINTLQQAGTAYNHYCLFAPSAILSHLAAVALTFKIATAQGECDLIVRVVMLLYACFCVDSG